MFAGVPVNPSSCPERSPMLERATMPPTAPLTRRQIREAERRAAQEAIREAAAQASASLASARVVTIPLDGTFAPIGRLSEPANVAPHTAPVSSPARRPSRAELRAAQRPPRRRAPLWMPRAAVVGALGAATIVAPIVGFAGPGSGETSQSPAVDTVAAGRTILDALDSAALEYDAETAGSAAALLADNSATARALVQSSRSYDRDAAPTCTVPGGSAGNGAGAALGAERMVMPLKAGSYTQSSLYGHRVHPINGRWSMHHGLDFAAPLGTPIHAIADGTVIHAGLGKDGRSSMLIIIEHEVDGETFYSWYVHMYPAGVYVTEGQSVGVGDVIGEVGNNGNSTGPHLHLEIHLDQHGTTTDPGAFLADRQASMLAASC